MTRIINRSRWAAVGAAVAVTLGAGGVGITQATTSSGQRSIYQPIEPCRLADLRQAPDQVGPRSAPLGPGETETLDGWGTVGDCDLPTDTSALALNVTALGATEPTFLTLFPAGTARPEASNLNPVPGQPPTPNAVTITLNDAGEFSVFNLAGNVNVIIDVTGVYEDHNHDDRYFTKAEVNARLSGEFTCPAADFHPRSDIGYSGNDVRRGASNAMTATFACGVQLPVGAVITGLRAVMVDESATFGTGCALGRSDASAIVIGIASTPATSASSSKPQILEAPSITDPVVESGTSHRIVCRLTAEIGIVLATVTYDVS